LISETSKIEDKLTEEEQKRNIFGQTLQYQCDLQIPNQKIMPVVKQYHLPPLPPNSHPFILLPQALIGVKAPPDLPRLQSIEIESAVPLHIHVDVFGSRSQKASLLIGLADNYDASKREDISRQFLGKTCSLWPYQREVLIVGFSDKEYEHFLDRPSKKFSIKETEQWTYKAEALKKNGKKLALSTVA